MAIRELREEMIRVKQDSGCAKTPSSFLRWFDDGLNGDSPSSRDYSNNDNLAEASDSEFGSDFKGIDANVDVSY